MKRCASTHPDGRRCLLPAHAHGRHLVAPDGPASRDLKLRLVTAWDYPAPIRERCAECPGAAEEVVAACEVLSTMILEPLREHHLRSALPSISAVVGEA